MSELFNQFDSSNKNTLMKPLADRMRPNSIDDVFGQTHLLGSDGPLRSFFETGDFPSMIFWGPPGVGKTTLALIIAQSSGYHFIKISAIDSGVKELRQIISNAERLRKGSVKTLLFIDEIHRFNKTQQDSLLHAVENGIIILIGATTENPSFEVNSALLSRCQIYRLLNLTDEEIKSIVLRALSTDLLLSKFNIKIESFEFLNSIAGGDARTALNAIELAIKIANKNDNGELVINRNILEKALQQKTAAYDKHGEQHYDTISAFIKSIRGSDPDAALLWLAKMLDAGEEPRFIARRMVIFASEDIGNADPGALTLAISVFQAVEMIGLPECRINLAQGVTYLASCPKSNASYMGIKHAEEAVKRAAGLIVPLHLRNGVTNYMKSEGYGSGYKYPHDVAGNFIDENYFPDRFEPRIFYLPGSFGKEKLFKERLELLWKGRYKKS
ncbi:MAG: replication-associated recombination protein A [Candidatus Kapabacteria bacterium]|nr:replication-associated recombination protein A [Candidatus Kapabacteria bacterium]